MSDHHHIPARVLPTEYKHVLSVDFFRKFSLAERLKILLGYNVAVVVRVACRYSTGPIKPFVRAEVTKLLHPSDLLKNQMANALSEANEEWERDQEHLRRRNR